MLAAMSDEQFHRWEAVYRVEGEQSMRDHVSRNADAAIEELKGNVV